MTREEIAGIAKEAKILGLVSSGYIDGLERFAALVEAHEREECAKLCETYFKHHPPNYQSVASNCADLIRKRGEQ